MKTSILNPDQEITLSSGEKITIKELTWRKATQFFDKLEVSIKPFMSNSGAPGSDAMYDSIMGAIKSNIELAEWLVKEATGKDENWLGDLTLSDASAVLSKSLEVNLAAVASQIKNVRGRLAVVAAGEQTSKSNPTSQPSAMQ